MGVTAPGQRSDDTWLQVTVRCASPVTASGTTPGGVDLMVPSVVAVADLLPELVAALASDRPDNWNEGLRITLVGGQTLDWGRTLTEQGVPPGAVLVVECAPPPAFRDDDVTEAVARVVSGQVRTSAHGRGAMAAGAALATLLGALSLATGPPSIWRCLALGAVTALAALAAWLVQRSRPTRLLHTVPSVALAALALALVFPTVVTLPWGPSDLGDRALLGVVAVGVAGALAAGWPASRSAGAAALVLGLTASGALAVQTWWQWSPPRSWSVLLPVMVVLNSLVPRWLVRRGDRWLPGEASTFELDERWLASDTTDLERGRDLWSGWSAGCALVVPLATWWLCDAGPSGVALAVLAALALALAATSSALPVIDAWAWVGLVATLSVVSAHGLLRSDPWAPHWALLVMTAGAVATTVDLVGPVHLLARQRWTVRAEGAAVFCLIPLAALGSGLMKQVAG